MVKLRRKLTRKGPLPFRYVLLLTFLFFMLSTGVGLWLINREIEPTLMKYAEAQTKEIATLVNSELNAGTYKYEFDASHLSTGIYFCELEAGDFKEIKKMTLIK